MRKEIKELIEKNCDLQMSLNEVTEDYKLLKEECDRLQDRVSMTEKHQST